MENIIVVAILAVILVFAVRSSMKHFRGEGGCCGGGKVPKAKPKKLNGPKVAEKIIHIEGMHCENCKNRIEKTLNQMDGVAAKVDLGKKIARVSLEKQVADEVLKNAIEKQDFKVTGIETKEA